MSADRVSVVGVTMGALPLRRLRFVGRGGEFGASPGAVPVVSDLIAALRSRREGPFGLDDFSRARATRAWEEFS